MSTVMQTLCFGTVFFSKTTQRFYCNERQMERTIYCKILDRNLLPSAKTTKMGLGWVFQYDIEPKHTTKVTKEGLNKYIKTTGVASSL